MGKLVHLVLTPRPSTPRSEPAKVHQLRDRPGTVEVLLRMAHGIEDYEGRGFEAISLYKQALRLYPAGEHVASTLVNIGFVHYQLHHIATAKHYFMKALQVDPNYHDALYNAGYLHYELARLPEALNFLRQALQVRPYDLSTHHALGRVYYASGDLLQAQEYLFAALQMAIDSPSLHQMIEEDLVRVQTQLSQQKANRSMS